MVLLGFYPRDCRYEPSEVRVKPHLPLRWWLAHLSWFCRAVLPQLASEQQSIPENKNLTENPIFLKLDHKNCFTKCVGSLRIVLSP